MEIRWYRDEIIEMRYTWNLNETGSNQKRDRNTIDKEIHKRNGIEMR
jgi:hypothetical protein